MDQNRQCPAGPAESVRQPASSPAWEGDESNVFLHYLDTGSSESFTAIDKYHRARLVNYIRETYCKDDPSLANDIVQEVFTKIVKKALTFDRERKFKPWLYAVACNAAVDMWRVQTRRGARTVRLGAPIPGGESDATLDLADPLDVVGEVDDAEELSMQTDQLYAVINGLSDPLREVMLLRAKGFEYPQIADKLKIKVGTVKSRLHAAMEIVRGELVDIGF